MARVIVALCGGLGSGKTLLMSVLAADIAEKGRPVIANYPLHCATRVYTWNEVFAFRDGCFAWDEAHVDLDSRDFKNHKESTSWLLQTRKDGLDLLLTTQHFGQVDNRLRQICDVLIQCEKVQAGSYRASRASVIDLNTMQCTRRFVFRHGPDLYALYDTKAKVGALV